MVKLPIYMDNNSTTRCDPRVVEAMLPYFSELYGNPASRHHRFGNQAADAVETSREQVADLIGTSPKEPCSLHVEQFSLPGEVDQPAVQPASPGVMPLLP